ncbi:MAG: hypothetical protein A2X24_01135 [Chloroflexi bacterium GWB2_54_36]|nr:MAG: hypothetical protein A2X24_01135 [Chloroflexi bacterium GWB2_54_36]HBA91687.1 peptidase [Anaerolineaceae bacterium]
MTKVNPNILKWARETAGLTLEEASRKLHINDLRDISAIDRLRNLEDGHDIPSRAMLINMSKHYHRPLVVFYMSNPPRKGNQGQDFRTLPQEYPIQKRALVEALIRNIQARQSIIRAGMEDEEDIQVLRFVKSMQVSNGVLALVESIKETLQFDLKVFRKKATPQEAFGYLRTCVENCGIFVLLISDLGSHHTTIGLEGFRGFALADSAAPFVVINDKDSKAAWSFTLIHEITHIWLGQTGISNTSFEKGIEKFCNDVASEILMPEDELSQYDFDTQGGFEELTKQVSYFAQKRNLSSTMVAYKLYRKGWFDFETWTKLSRTYQSMWNENKKIQRIISREKKSGPDYYTLRRFMVGTSLISTVKRMMAGGTITTTKAGKILGVKAKNVQKLMDINGPSKMGHIF